MTQNLCLRCVPWKEELKWTPELKKKNPKTGLTHLNLHAQSSAAHTQHQNDNTEGSHFSDDARGLCRFLLWSQVICAASYKACRQISEWFINNSLRRLKVRWHWLVGDNPKAAAAVDPLFSLFYSPHPLSLLFITSISLFPPSEQCSVIDFGIHTKHTITQCCPINLPSCLFSHRYSSQSCLISPGSYTYSTRPCRSFVWWVPLHGAGDILCQM